jgi:polysaccharide export outer membrane protein
MSVPLHPVLAVLLAVLAFSLGPGICLGGDLLPGYRLSSGDKVRIAVFGEPELSVSDWISGRGTVAYPLLGELHVVGLTPSELETLLTSRLKGPYLVDPKVTVTIEAYREFFVMGQVNRPGSYAYSPGMTVRKAISIAGGFTERASRSKIFRVSEVAPDEEQKVGENDPLGPGDTVVVKGSFF